MGQERLYAVRNVADLLTCFALGAPLALSGKFTYRPSVMRFSREDERLLTLLMNHIPLRAETLRQREEGGAPAGERPQGPQSDGRFVIMTGALLHGVLRYFETHPFVLLRGEEKSAQSGIRTMELPLCFSVALTPHGPDRAGRGRGEPAPGQPRRALRALGGAVAHLHSAQARVCGFCARRAGASAIPPGGGGNAGHAPAGAVHGRNRGALAGAGRPAADRAP